MSYTAYFSSPYDNYFYKQYWHRLNQLTDWFWQTEKVLQQFKALLFCNIYTVIKNKDFFFFLNTCNFHNSDMGLHYENISALPLTHLYLVASHSMRTTAVHILILKPHCLPEKLSNTTRPFSLFLPRWCQVFKNYFCFSTCIFTVPDLIF